MKHITFLFSLLIPALLYAVNPETKGLPDKRPKGFYDVTSISFSPFNSPVVNGIRTINGYRINPHLAVGLGIGLERYVDISTYDTIKANLSVMPVFADVRYTVLKGNVTPVVALNGGYTFLINRPSSAEYFRTQQIFPPYAWNDYYDYDHYDKGGFYFNAEAGVKVKIYRKIALTGSLNYSLWQIYGEHRSSVYQNLPDGNGGTKKNLIYSSERVMAYISAILFRVGVAF